MCIALTCAEMRVGVVRSRIYVMGRIFRMGWFVDGGCCQNRDLGDFRVPDNRKALDCGGDVWKTPVPLCELGLLDSQLRVARKHLKVDIVMQNGRHEPRSRRTTGAHSVEVPFPTDPSKRPGLIDRHGFGRKGAQREVNRLTLGRKPIAAHHLGARLIIDVNVGAGHTPAGPDREGAIRFDLGRS